MSEIQVLRINWLFQLFQKSGRQMLLFIILSHLIDALLSLLYLSYKENLPDAASVVLGAFSHSYGYIDYCLMSLYLKIELSKEQNDLSPVKLSFRDLRAFERQLLLLLNQRLRPRSYPIRKTTNFLIF